LRPLRCDKNGDPKNVYSLFQNPHPGIDRIL